MCALFLMYTMCYCRTELLLNIVRPADVMPCAEHRLIWCPYMPEDDDQSTSTGATLDSCPTDDAAKLLVLTHGSTVSIDSGYKAVAIHVETAVHYVAHSKS